MHGYCPFLSSFQVTLTLSSKYLAADGQIDARTHALGRFFCQEARSSTTAMRGLQLRRSPSVLGRYLKLLLLSIVSLESLVVVRKISSGVWVIMHPVVVLVNLCGG